MKDALLHKYTGGRGLERLEGAGPEAEAVDTAGCFGWLRGVRDRAVMLELRQKTGAITAFGYAWLERAEFDPSEGITLHLGGRAVRIRGRNLNGSDSSGSSERNLFAGIVRHRVPWVQEAASSAGLIAEKGETVVEVIDLSQ